MRNSLVLAIVGLALGIGADASASVYRCKNSDGSVRYQETPCNAGAQGTRLETHSPADRQRAYPQGGVTWGDVRRAKAQCDENARRSYAEHDWRRQDARARCMQRIDKACSDKSSSRCRSAIRSTGRRVERSRRSQTRKTSADPELEMAKANCHAWTSAEPNYNTRRNRERACQALAGACRNDRQGPECRQRIQQLQPR